jgi:uncharacterized protein YcbK (DUF882 family)
MKPFALQTASLANHRLNRRRFLSWGALATAVSLCPRFVHAGERSVSPPERSVAFYNTHTGESLDAIYWVKGRYLPDALEAVDYILRDHRTDETIAIDPQLLDLLHTLRQELACRHAFHVVSGYRSPATNAYLRRHYRGVAEHSLHIEGKAVDLRLPGFDCAWLRRAAMELQAGGVGYYPRADFVHLDVGPVRWW